MKIFPPHTHFCSADCLIPVMCCSDCGGVGRCGRTVIMGRKPEMDSSQMLLSEGSKPSNAAEGQSLHHFRCRTPKTRRPPRSRDLCRGHGPIGVDAMHCTGCNICQSEKTNNLLTIIEMLNSRPCNVPLCTDTTRLHTRRRQRRSAEFHYSKAHFIYHMGTLLCM